MRPYYVYILQCADGTFYTGMTNDLSRRLNSHMAGTEKGSYTSKRRPVKLVWYGEFIFVQDAIDTEKRVKNWSKAKKVALINGDETGLQIHSKKKFRNIE